jgi:predicted ATPase
MTEEARERIERFRRKKLHPPLKWSDKLWEETCAALAKLAAEFPETAESSAESPVAGY